MSSSRTGGGGNPKHSGGGSSSTPAAAAAAAAARERPDIPTVTFDTSTSTTASYTALIATIMGFLAFPENTRWGFTLLPPPISLHHVSNFFFVIVKNFKHEVKFVCRKSDLYMVAVFANNTVHFFSDTTRKAMEDIFPDTVANVLPLEFNGSYPSLEGRTGYHRLSFRFGMPALTRAVCELATYNNKSKGAQKIDVFVSKASYVFIVMVSEAIRFRALRENVAAIANPINPDFEHMPPQANRYGNFVLSSYDAHLLNQWGKLCDRVYEAATVDSTFADVTITGGTDVTRADFLTDEDFYAAQALRVTCVGQVQQKVLVLNSRN